MSNPSLPSFSLFPALSVRSRRRSLAHVMWILQTCSFGGVGASGLLCLHVVVDFLLHFRLNQTLSILKVETNLVSQSPTRLIGGSGSLVSDLRGCGVVQLEGEEENRGAGRIQTAAT